jgi:hypothetical protein
MRNTGEPLRRPRREEYNIKINLKRIDCKDERRENGIISGSCLIAVRRIQSSEYTIIKV